MGGIGVVVIGLLHPERFAAVHAFIPPLRMGGMMGGQPNPMLPMIPAEYVAQHPGKDYPYIMYTAGRTDNIVGWPDKLEFAKALQAVQAGFTLYWDLRWHDQNYTGKVPESLKEPPVPWGRTPARPQMPVTSFSRKQSFPAISKLSVDSDPGTVNFAVKPAERPPLETPGAGDLIGTINGAVAWDRDSITDTPRRYEITLRLMPFAAADNANATITPRRMQQFRPAAGRNCHYRVTDAGSRKVLLKGETKPDTYGRVSVEQVPITKTGIRLALW
jgi:hypothetical protein